MTIRRTVASPTNPSAQVTIVGNDDMAAPGISVEVADVDAVHAKAVEQGFEIAYPLRDEEWESGASCFASRAARSSTSCRIVRGERLPGDHAEVSTRGEAGALAHRLGLDAA